MAVQKEIIILGDVEIGGGTLTDDFISDKTLSNLILELSGREHPVDLVFNGDTFDFLKCPVIIKDRRIFPRHITEDISLAKLNLIYNAHSQVFAALRKLASKDDKHVYFVLGNHDQDLIFRNVQQEIRNLLGSPHKIHFPGLKYRHSCIYAEHGHQYDFLNKINPKHLFLNYNNQRILNIPWVSFGLISKFMEMKEEHPFMERIFPRQAVFARHRNLFKEVSHESLIYLAKSMIYYPLRYRHDPTYTYPKELLREFYRRYMNVHWDVENIVNSFRKKMKRSKYKIHILGHVHEKFLEEKNGRVIIQLGSWRDEYDLDSGKLVPREKRYVKVLIDENGASYRLVNVFTERSTLDFDIVRMDEHSSVKLAADEERI